MKKIKKKPVVFQAWQLGTGSDQETEMIRLGRIKNLENGTYELFSQETIHTEHGEIAAKYDYFKVDSSGFPYPNAKERFEKKNVSVGENKWQEKPAVYETWEIADGEDPTIRYLLDTGKLVIKESSEEDYFTAYVSWGTLKGPKTDHVIIYNTEEKEDGSISIDFALIADKQFQETYEFTK